MDDVVNFIIRHGVAFVFLYVLADQLGIPVPAVPALLALGALGGVGKINVPLAFLVAVLASVLADTVWYTLGRTRGSRVLRLVCTISLEPDSCVRRTESVFLRRGIRALIFSKFVPGLSTVAPPLAGMVGIAAPRFLFYSTLSAVLWVGAWSGLGYLAGGAAERVADVSGRFGTGLVTLVAGVVASYVVVKWIQRRRFLRNLRIARVSPDDVHRELVAGTPLLIVDLRTELDVAAAPWVIPGALRIAADELERRHRDIPRDREVIVYCS